MSSSHLRLPRLWAVAPLASACCLLLAGAPARAQNLSLRVDQVDLGEFPRIELFVTATDMDGAPVKGLDASAFGVIEDGAPVTGISVRTFLESGEGLAVVLALDVSGSMRGEPIRNARDAARTFISKLSPEDQVAVITFGHRVSLESGFAQDRTTTYTRLGTIEATGHKTMLFDGVHEAAKRLSTPGLPARKVIIVLSDGRDEGSAVTLEDCVKAARRERIQISTVGLSRLGEGSLKSLRRLARLTDGTFLWARSPDDLGMIYSGLAERLRNSYVVSFEAKAIKADGAEHSVKLKVASAGGPAEALEQFVVPRALKQPEPASAASDAGPAPVPDGGSDGGEAGAGQERPLWLYLAVGGGALVAVALVLIIVVALVRRRKRRCPQCGAELDPETGACPVCEAQAPVPSEPAAPFPAPLPATAPVAEAPAAPVLATLIVRAGEQKGQTFAITEESVLAGREADSCQVLLEDEAVSRVHFNIQLSAGRFFLTDMNSSFGTKLNGQPVSEPSELNNNDIITVGDTELLFQDRR